MSEGLMDGLYKKIKSSYEDIVVGNTVFTKEEIANINNYIGESLREFVSERGETMYSSSNDIAFVAMVNAAKEWNSDETRFWEHLCSKIAGVEYSQKLYKYFTDVIDYLEKKGKIQSIGYFQKRYYATLCAYSLAPQKSMEGLFDLCWRIYSDDFDFALAPKEDIRYIAEQLKLKFKGAKNDDELNLGANTYSIRVGIQGITIDYSEKMVMILETIFKLIDRKYNNRDISELRGTYIESLVSEWWKKKQTIFGKTNRLSDKKRGQIIKDYSNINAKYIYEDETVNLFIPPIRLMGNYEYNPYLSIYLGEECINNIELYTHGSGLMMSTNSQYIDVNEYVLNNTINDLRITIEHCERVIYDSKNSLHREYILFSNGKEILSSNCLPGNYFLFTSDLKLFDTRPSSINYINGSKYAFYANEGDVLQNSDKTVFFQNESEFSQIRKKMNVISNVVFQSDEKEYSVIDGNLKIVIDESINPRSIGIRYDNEVYNLTQFTSKKNQGYEEYNVSENICVGEAKTINIFDYATNKILMVSDIIKFKNINITYDRTIYFDKVSNGSVYFKTEKYDKNISFNIYNDEIAIPIENGKLVFFPPILKWRFSNQEWNTRVIENIWYKDVANNAEIEIKNPDNSESILLTNECDFLEKNCDNNFIFGELLYKKSDSGNNDLFLICKNPLIEDPNKMTQLAQFLFCAKIIDDSIIELDNKVLYWNPEQFFVGNSNSKFKLIIKKNDVVLSELKVDCKNTESSIDLDCDGLIAIDIYLITGGFAKKEEKLIYTKKVEVEK